jgi:putative endonuclease
VREYHFYVYIMASKSRTLYIGFTSKLGLRVSQHKNGTFEGFSKDYQCHRLVFYQCFQWAEAGIAREKQLKRWARAKKIFLIEKDNPTWEDLSEEWGKPAAPFIEPSV